MMAWSTRIARWIVGEDCVTCANLAVDAAARAGGAGQPPHSAPLRRSTSLSRSAAAITAGACSRPGWRDRRSIGPDTLTAAMTLPEGERTGAETDATPASR